MQTNYTGVTMCHRLNQERLVPCIYMFRSVCSQLQVEQEAKLLLG